MQTITSQHRTRPHVNRFPASRPHTSATRSHATATITATVGTTTAAITATMATTTIAGRNTAGDRSSGYFAAENLGKVGSLTRTATNPETTMAGHSAASITIKYGSEIEGITIAAEGVEKLWPGANDKQVVKALTELMIETALRGVIISRVTGPTVDQFIDDYITEAS